MSGNTMPDYWQLERFGVHYYHPTSFYCDQADSKLEEMNKLIELVADEWDDGMAHYNLKPSEVVP